MKPVNILLADDSQADADLIHEALLENRFYANFYHVADGEQAMAFLRHESPYTDAVTPDILLLDLNMPRKSGHEVLAEIKTDPDLCWLPVVILTTSTAQSDLVDTYAHHANAFLTKPMDFNEFMGLIRRLGDFWLAAVKLPPHD